MGCGLRTCAGIGHHAAISSGGVTDGEGAAAVELNKEAVPLEDLLGARLSLCGGPAQGRRSAEEDGGEGRRRRRMVAG